MTKKQFVEQSTQYILLALNLADKARLKGLLALEEDCENIADEYFKKGLRFAVDAIDPRLIDEIMSARLSHEKTEYMRLLRTIQKRGVIGIQSGESPRILYEVLTAYAGLPKKQEELIYSALLKIERNAKKRWQETKTEETAVLSESEIDELLSKITDED